MLQLYPKAHIYTSLINKETIKKLGLHTKHIYALPIPQKFFSKHIALFQALSPLLWKFHDFTDYDVTISISGYMMSNLVKVKKPINIQYLLCPPKNVFDIEDKSRFQKIFPYQMYLRTFVYNAVRRTPDIITLSQHMSGVIDNLFHMPSRVIYPPVRISKYHANYKNGKYFLIVSRIDSSKSLELAIHACNALKQQLLIIGQTNELAYLRYLRSISGPSIRFLGYLSDKQKEQYYLKAKAFIFTAKNEDFGIAPIEAMGYGLPVISYYGGALKETMINNKTGIFYYKHTTSSLIGAINQFRSIRFDAKFIHLHAEKYSEKRFLNEFNAYVHDAIRLKMRHS